MNISTEILTQVWKSSLKRSISINEFISLKVLLNSFEMTFYDNVDWVGFLTENVMRKCISWTLAECPGCQDGMKNDILHQHHQLSLLDQVQNHFEKARGEVIGSIPALYKIFSPSLPHSSDPKKDAVIFCNLGKTFLLTSSPQALYFGRYINSLNDSCISEAMVKVKRAKL